MGDVIAYDHLRIGRVPEMVEPCSVDEEPEHPREHVVNERLSDGAADPVRRESQ